MRRLILALTATAIVVAASYTVATPPSASPAAEPTSASQTNPIGTQAPSVGPAIVIPAPTASTVEADVPAELTRLIDVFSRRTDGSRDALDYRTLGGHYATKASITGDIADYEAAVTAYAAAVSLAPTDLAGKLGYAGAASKVHDFTLALTLSESVLDEEPRNPAALAIAVDSLIELGRIEAGVDYLDRLEVALPDRPEVLARLANVAHLTGDQQSAIDLAREAEERAIDEGTSGAALAFYPLLRTDLLLDAGRYAEAEVAVRRAVDIDAGYAPAQASLGRVLAHQGNLAAALDAYTDAIAIAADPGWDAAAGELLVAMGRDAEAAPYFDRAVANLAGGDEAIFGRSLSVLYSDLDIMPAEALRLAREDIERRQDIHAYDTLAWALYRSGDLTGAREASNLALSTGAMDAGLLYHSAVIAAAAGDVERAVSELTTLLDTNPGFSPDSSQVRRLLASLAG